MSPEQWRDGWNALWTEPYNKVAATFGALKRHFTLCAFSNTNAEHAESFMQRYPHILSQFDQLFLSHEVGCRKPSAEAFLHVCDLMRTKPQQVTFLDDSLENVAGARAANSPPITPEVKPKCCPYWVSFSCHRSATGSIHKGDQPQRLFSGRAADAGSGAKRAQKSGRSGEPNKRQANVSSKWMHGTPAGLPFGMPGSADAMLGAIQQAPQPWRQFTDCTDEPALHISRPSAALHPASPRVAQK